MTYRPVHKTILGFIKKELLQTLRDKRMRVVLFVAPVLQMVLFGIAISNEVRNVTIAAQFAPHDALMERIVARSLASTWFIPAEVEGDDPASWLTASQAEAAIIAPPLGLAKGLAEGQATLQILINAQNVLRAQAIENYLKTIVNQVVSEELFIKPVAPMDFDVRVLFNPTLETSNFMVPGVLCMLLCVVTILLTSMSLAREKEMGTLETLISAPVKSWEIILGKTVPFVLLGLTELPLILLVAVLGFGVPMRGPLLFILVAGFFFVLTTVSIGTLISTLAKNQQQAMLGGLLFLFPAILLSGLMFPIENMPDYMRWITMLNPLTHFIALLRNILLKGGDLHFFLVHTGMLMGLSMVGIFFAFSRFKTRLS